jgi:HAD superfamily hydrolase (TIGR01509 family)
VTQSLADILGPVRCLLFDFDGPIADVFAGYPARPIADHLWRLLQANYHGEIPDSLVAVKWDPFLTLRKVEKLGDPELTRLIDDACQDAEVTAASSAVPTPGAADSLRAARESGRKVAIVSNNSADAIEAFLQAHDLLKYVDGIVARFRGMPPHLLKPHPFLVERGRAVAGAAPAEATMFVGDSESDVVAGNAAGVPTIGYANKPGKHERLAEAGAVTVIQSMAALARALHPARTSPQRD